MEALERERVRITPGENPVKQIRKALGMTQNEFASLLGTYRKTVIRWEKGETRAVFSLRQIKALDSQMATIGLRFQDLPDDLDR